MEACKLRNYIEKSINTLVACRKPSLQMAVSPFFGHIHIHSKKKSKKFVYKIWREKTTSNGLFLFFGHIHIHSETSLENKYKRKLKTNHFEWLVLILLANHPHPFTQLCSGKALLIKSKSKDYFHKETKEKSYR